MFVQDTVQHIWLIVKLAHSDLAGHIEIHFSSSMNVPFQKEESFHDHLCQRHQACWAHLASND